jgi:hypothetical protein
MFEMHRNTMMERKTFEEEVAKYKRGESIQEINCTRSQN